MAGVRVDSAQPLMRRPKWTCDPNRIAERRPRSYGRIERLKVRSEDGAGVMQLSPCANATASMGNLTRRNAQAASRVIFLEGVDGFTGAR